MDFRDMLSLSFDALKGVGGIGAGFTAFFNEQLRNLAPNIHVIYIQRTARREF